MRILRIRLRDFRGIVDRVIDLAPHGVTIVEGPNEAGKTSIADAIGMVFDLPDSTHKQAVRELQPIDRDAGTEVEVEVETGPYRFTLSKRFNKDRATRLSISAPRIEHHTGREAHERARAILDETIDVALWRALCVQQGTGGRQAHLAASPSLAAALDSAAGGLEQVGEAELSLLARVTEEFLEYFTERGAPGRPLRASAAHVDAAEAALEQADLRLQELEDDVELAAELDIVVQTTREHVAAAEQTAAAADAARLDAAERAAAVERIAQEAALAGLAASSAAREVALRVERVHEVTRLAAEREQHEAAAALATEHLAAAEQAGQRAESMQSDHFEAAEAAEELLALRRADLEGGREHAALVTATRQRDRVTAALTAAAGARASLERSRVDDDILGSIRALDLDERQARAALDAGSPTITVTAPASTTIVIEGGLESAGNNGSDDSTASSATAQVFHASQPMAVEAPGVLRVEIAPGQGATDLVAAHANARRALLAACAAAGVDDLVSAERVAREASEARRALHDAEAVLDEHLGGRRLEDLDEEIAWLEHRAAEREGTRPEQPLPPADLADARQLARAAEDAARVAAAALATGEAARRAAAIAVETARATAQREGALAERAGARCDDATQVLAIARAEIGDEELPAVAAQAAERAATIEASLVAARTARAGADSAAAATLAANAAEVLRAARIKLRQLEDKRRDVATRLTLRGEDGRFDAREDAAAALVAAQRSHDAITQRSEAARRLYDTLIACRDEARRSYQEPLRATIEELGRVLYGPTFAVELDDELQIARRMLDGHALPFRLLSAGAQEQLALLGRLASAMLVSRDGGVPLVLDDTLGASDPDRLERMGAVLRLAGQRCQVVVLTCFPQRFRFVGGATVVQLVA